MRTMGGDLGASASAHHLSYADASAPGRRAKPFGAACLQVFVAVADGLARDPAAAAFYAAVTTSPFAVTFGPAEGGRYATYFVRQASLRGDVGPSPLCVGLHVAA